MRGCEARDRFSGDGGVGELHGAVDHGLEDLLAEGLGHPRHDLLRVQGARIEHGRKDPVDLERGDRKSTRLNSSHVATSYAVFCLKKKNKTTSSNQYH